MAAAADPGRGDRDLVWAEPRLLEFSKGPVSLGTGPEQTHDSLWHLQR